MPSNYGTFQFTADVVNGKILEFPKTFYLQCSCVKPLGTDIIRQYSKTQCIIAKKVFLIYCSGEVLGSSQFTGVAQFVQYVNNSCNPPVPCGVTINGCSAMIAGCNVVLSISGQTCALTLAGCSATINGCSLNYTTNQ